MIALPVPLSPPAPFPLVTAQSTASEFVAPGIERTDIRLRTAAGPLVIHVVAIDETQASVRFGTVIAHDRLVSAGETVSSMAARTSAVAGINADYFDIGNTNQPLNVVVHNGALLRSPSKRVALLVGDGNRVRFSNVVLNGTATYNGVQLPITGVNIWPPQGGLSLMTSAYGASTPSPDVGVIPIALVNAGRYIVQATPAAADSPSLAFGPAARAIASPPPAGTPIDLHFDLDPPLGGIREAVGGGPLLVDDSAAVHDLNEPAPEERNVRFPLAGAGIVNATLLLVAVDGRTPSESIGLTRPEFAALFLGLGARSAMAFDSGGSATLVARRLGDDRATVVNAPSDGEERPVADGLFAYSDARAGDRPHLVARPAATLALTGATIVLQGAIVDDAGHRLAPAPLAPVIALPVPGPHAAFVTSGAYHATIAYRTVTSAHRLSILPEHLNPKSGESIVVHAVATDAFGSPIALGTVHWAASAGTMAANGAAATYRASGHDASLTATIADQSATIVVRIGSRVVPLDIFAAPDWRFVTAPAGAAGAIDLAADELGLTFDLSNARAAYANTARVLPAEAKSFAVDVLGDGSGVGLRAAFVNKFGERRALTLAKRIDWSGWKRLTIELPPDLNAPVQLVALYVARLAEAPLHAAGTIRFRNAAAAIAGTP